MPDYHAGRVSAVIFENDAQSFYVLEMILDGGSSLEGVAVRGNVPGLRVRVGCWFGFEGHWETHDKYGRQIVIDKAPLVRGEWNAETALKMLQSHGVGLRVCDALYAHFGDDLLGVLALADELQKVSSITEFTAQHIVNRWQAVRAMFQSLEFLSDLKLPKSKVEQIYAHFGDDAEATLSQDPWALVQIDGIRFEHADEVARRLGLDMACDKRIAAAALHTCKSRRGVGHLYLHSGELVQGIEQHIEGIPKERVARVLKKMHDDGLVFIDNRTKPGVTAIYEPWYYRLECECAELLARRLVSAEISEANRSLYLDKLAVVGPATAAEAHQGASLRDVAKKAIEEWSEQGKMTLTGDQLAAAVSALVDSVAVITGLPGTGKTTTLRVVVKVLQDAGVPFLLVAPTGIAAKRLSSVTGAEASTIHRAFAAKGMGSDDGRESTYAGIVGFATLGISDDGSGENWGFSAQQPHPARVIVVDEASMVDQHLLFRLLTCTASDCRLVFVGDAAQLPSVGPGNVLRDLISSRHFPVVDLREIFRQDEASDIILAAHAINRGDVPEFESKSTDFVTVEVRDEAKILETLVSTVQRLYERRINFQVLSPRHAGTLGVTNLNLRIRELLNPKTPGLREMRLGSETVREGDRVMVSKNNYRFDIFNGDVGKVSRLDQREKIVELKIHGPPVMQVQMPFKDAPSHLRMAYAITVHKSQGQEYDVILLPWVSSFRSQLIRNLLYTAITRARKKVILIGHPEAIQKAVQNNRVDARNTLFPERLSEFLDPKKLTGSKG
jgi:exodeoxyribonuclease V alpha subunit